MKRQQAPCVSVTAYLLPRIPIWGSIETAPARAVTARRPRSFPGFLSGAPLKSRDLLHVSQQLAENLPQIPIWQSGVGRPETFFRAARGSEKASPGRGTRAETPTLRPPYQPIPFPGFLPGKSGVGRPETFFRAARGSEKASSGRGTRAETPKIDHLPSGVSSPDSYRGSPETFGRDGAVRQDVL